MFSATELKAQMVRKGFTQEKLANAIGITTKTLNLKIKSGQIVDMIKEKFDVQVSVTAVRGLLKKRPQEAEEWFAPGKGRYGNATRVL